MLKQVFSLLSECDNGWYGVNCSSSCGHCLGGGEQCQHVNGTCLSGCVPGWQDGLCTDSKLGYMYMHSCILIMN